MANGQVLTLTASVTAGGAAVTRGQVHFCDASAKFCTDIHRLGTAQLTGGGKAILRIRPAIGAHSYKANFAGTQSYAASTSAIAAERVTGAPGPVSTTTTLTETGGWGQYALTATVNEAGSTVPPVGAVSFADTSSGNRVLSSATLGASTAGLAWPDPVLLRTLTGPRALAIGDFNEDGIPDLAASAGDSGKPFLVYLRKANGTYTAVPPLRTPLWAAPSMVVADFNGDGHADVAFIDTIEDQVVILMGHGDGTFTLLTSLSTSGSNPQQLVTGDFNGDGLPDLAVTSDGSNTVNILLGKGDGTFTATSTGPTVGASPNAMTVGDFNGDGKLDIAVTDHYDDTVSIYLGKGNGSFTPATTVHCGSSSSPIEAGDFNGDGKLDLVVAVQGSKGQDDGVRVLFGDGKGTFAASSFSGVTNSGSITSLALGDFNADGIADVVLANSQAGVMRVLTGNGHGSFTSTTQAAPPSVYPQLMLATADMYGDGRTDIVVGNGDGGVTIGIYRTEPSQTASATTRLTLAGVGEHLVDATYAGDAQYHGSTSNKLDLWGVPPVTTSSLTVTAGGTHVTSVAAGTAVTLTATVKAGASLTTGGEVKFCDAAARQCADIHLLGTAAVSKSGTAALKFIPAPGQHSYKAVYLESSAGKMSDSNTVALTVTGSKPPTYTDTTSLAVSGLPGNYTLTASVEGFGGTAVPTGSVSFIDTSFKNAVLGKATLGPAVSGIGWRTPQSFALPYQPVSVAAGDFNGDGIPDVAVMRSCDSFELNGCVVTVYLGKGNGTFTTGPTTSLNHPGMEFTSLAAADFNRDGKTDLVVLGSDYIRPYVMPLLGNGNGAFTVGAPTLANPTPQPGGDFVDGSVAIADFDGDGNLDLALVGNYVVGGISIMRGKGDGTFSLLSEAISPNSEFSQVASGDFNGDGIPDVVATQFFSPGTASVFLGKGDGSFGPAIPLALDSGARSLVTGDFNSDGILDLAVGYDGGVSVLLGKGNGTFAEAPGSPVRSSGDGLVIGDFNHDGKADLAGIDGYNGRIDLLLGSGNGTFTPLVATPTVNSNSQGPYILAAADFNLDGTSDLVIGSGSTSSVGVLIGEPTRTVSATISGIAPLGAGTHNVKASYSGNTVYSASASSTVALTAGLKALVITPAPGTYRSVETVTLHEAVPGATIYYSLVGPSSTNGYVVYKGPITLSAAGDWSIGAYSTESGYDQSDFLSASYTLILPPTPGPSISLASGRYADAQTVTITDPAAGAKIYYTIDGSVPTLSSHLYTGPLKVSASETIVASAVAYGYAFSPVATAQYIIASSPASLIYTVAGTGMYGYSGDKGPATLAEFDSPADVVKDSAGNLYIADLENHMVRKVAAGTGIVTRFAGTGVAGSSGDGGAAAEAELSYPERLVLDPAGDLLIADVGTGTIRKVRMATGIITTIAGKATATSGGDGGPATAAYLGSVLGMTFDAAGNLYISDASTGTIRKITAATGIITTIAGTGMYNYSGDGGPALSATFANLNEIAFDKSGNLYIADSINNVVRRIAATKGVISGSSIITTVAGGAGSGRAINGYYGDGGPATSALLSSPTALAFDRDGDLYIADSGNSVLRMVKTATGIISTVAGHKMACSSYGGDGDTAISAALCYPSGLTFDTHGNLYIADWYGDRVRQMPAPALPPGNTAAAPVFSVKSGTYASVQTVTISDSTPGASIYVTVDGSTPSTGLASGYSIPIQVGGTITIKAIASAPGYLNSRVAAATYNITAPSAIIKTIAGSGTFGFAGGAALAAKFGNLQGIAVNKAGDVYAADPLNNVVWALSAATGRVSVFAGTGASGYSGDGGAATGAELQYPEGIALDSAGNLYVADSANNAIRKVTAATGIISTVAGGYRYGSTYGDGGPATSANLFQPTAVALDGANNLYIADTYHYAIRKVLAKTGIISTVAGNRTSTTSGDGGLATRAGIMSPSELAVDRVGNIYFTSYGAATLRKVSAATGIISTIAGIADLHGDTGDGGPASKAEVDPTALALDAAGNLYIGNSPGRIRRLEARTGILTNVAGIGFAGFSGDGRVALDAQLSNTFGIAFDTAGNLYLSDSYNYRVRKVLLATPSAAVAPSLR